MIPQIAHDLAVDVKTAALLSTAFTLPYALMQPLLGSVSDFFGKTRMMNVSLLAVALSALICALSTSFSLVFAMRIMAGAVAIARGGGPVRPSSDLAAGVTAFTFGVLAALAFMWGVLHMWLGASLRRYKQWARLAALGLGIHFFIALNVAEVFYAASRHLPFLTERPVLSGVGYGVAVYLFMHTIVLPLSNVAKRPFDLGLAAVMVLIHILCIGLPISLTVWCGKAEESS